MSTDDQASRRRWLSRVPDRHLGGALDETGRATLCGSLGPVLPTTLRRYASGQPMESAERSVRLMRCLDGRLRRDLGGVLALGGLLGDAEHRSDLGPGSISGASVADGLE